MNLGFLWYKIRLNCYRPIYWWHEILPFWVANHLPHKVALFTFIRVYAIRGDVGPDYALIYNLWEAKYGKRKRMPNAAK